MSTSMKFRPLAQPRSVLPDEKKPAAPAPDSRSEKTVQADVPDSRSEKTAQADVPDNRSEKTVQADVPDSRSKKTVQADVPESRPEKTVQADVPESRSEKTVQADVPKSYGKTRHMVPAGFESTAADDWNQFTLKALRAYANKHLGMHVLPSVRKEQLVKDLCSRFGADM